MAASQPHKVLFEQLIRFAQLGHQTGVPSRATTSREQPWSSADMVHQEALYAIQGELLEILLACARSIDGKSGNAAERHLVAALPWAFTTTTTEKG